MAIQVLAMRNLMAEAYKANAPYGALFQSTGPGTSGAATNESTGGSPAYNRKSMGWGTAAASAVTGAPVFDVASGQTITYFGVTTSVTPGTADVKDNVAVTSQNFASEGTYTVTATYTQT